MPAPIYGLIVAPPAITAALLILRGEPGPPGPAADVTAETAARIAADSALSTAIATAIADIQTALAAKAPLSSPALTDVPTAPTAAAGTNTTQLATTAFVRTEVAALVNGASSTLDTLNELAAALGNDANFAATIATTIGGKLAKSANLSDLTDFAAARTSLQLGTAAVLNAGTGADNLLQLGTGGSAVLANGLTTGSGRVYSVGSTFEYGDATTKNAHRTAMGIGTGDSVVLAELTISAATASLNLSPVAGRNAFQEGGVPLMRFHGSYGVMIGTNGLVGGSDISSIDVMLSRISAGLWGVGTTSKGGFSGSMKLTNIEAVGTIELRNGTSAAGPLLINNTYTSSTVYERGFNKWSSNEFLIGTEKGSGGGTARGLSFQTDGTTRMSVGATGNVGIGITAALAPLHIYKDSLPNVGTFLLDQPSVPTGSTNLGPHFFFKSATSDRGWVGFFDNATHGSGTQLNIKSNGSVGFAAGSVGNANQLTLISSGYFGIGVTVPTSRLHVAETWNNVATTFTGALINITDAASAAGSLIQDWQVGGVSKASIAKSGAIVAENLTVSGNIKTNNGALWGAFGSIALGSSADLWLYRDAANVLAQRNGTNAQAFRIYNTYTDASNYERGFIKWNANVFQIGMESGGTGAGRTLQFVTGGGALWQINTSGVFGAVSDNAYDIGASGANRPRNLYVAGAGTFGGAGSFAGNVTGWDHIVASTSALYWASRSALRSPSDGVMSMTNGSVTAGVALDFATNGVLKIRNSANSADGFIKAKLQTDANAVAETPVPTHTLTLYDAAGTAYKVPCVAA
jgi:hypothetical protein